MTKVIEAKRFYVKLFLWRALPKKLQVNLVREGVGLREQFVGGRRCKVVQAMTALDFAALACAGFDLQGGIGL